MLIGIILLWECVCLRNGRRRWFWRLYVFAFMCFASCIVVWSSRCDARFFTTNVSPLSFSNEHVRTCVFALCSISMLSFVAMFEFDNSCGYVCIRQYTIGETSLCGGCLQTRRKIAMKETHMRITNIADWDICVCACVFCRYKTRNSMRVSKYDPVLEFYTYVFLLWMAFVRYFAWRGLIRVD